MTSAVSFKLQAAENSASKIVRRGTLQFPRKNRTIQTPACMTYTLRGSVPHLVADNLKLLPVEIAQVTLEQFLEQKEPSSFKYPHGIHKYLHLENCLIFCDIRDPLKMSPISFNTDKYLSVETHGGVRQVTPDLWGKAISIYRPDVVAAMADVVTDTEARAKRIKRSVDRSLRWLDENLIKAKELDIPVFAHVMGYNNVEERSRSASATAERDVQGFIINVLDMNKSELGRLVRASTDQLPTEKPRIAYGLATPEGILEGVSNGIDLFDGSYAYKVTEKGRAIILKFGEDLKEAKTDSDQPKTLNLWDSQLAQSFDVLDSTCGCDACSRPHSKAYIHHLLNAHEMLGPLLLMSHNVYQLDYFMKSIQKSIENDRFEQDKEAFMKHYNHLKEGDGMKDHEDELDTECLGVHLKKKRTLLL
ncbi:Queuine tRNA-ribosyltransferase subunit qtrtd1 [Choanephora cucurbitarum]|uniref:Queuine tRNA-ribosyltransferase accessory subunit 2 n=1 Tax=Choanephora cucurbitarum TaxID=101091 RepID=A0A1C7N4K1_9FUNG|nr:Queuine tRNA-ribosyltransferase subunit qtrtd1 [Choanephora cucurbitarum]